MLLDEMMSDLTTLVDGYLNTYREGSADRLAGTEVGAAFCGVVCILCVFLALNKVLSTVAVCVCVCSAGDQTQDLIHSQQTLY